MKPDSSTSFRFFIWSILAGNSGELKVSFLGSVLVTLGPKSMKKVQLVLKKVQITSKKGETLYFKLLESWNQYYQV